jgi:hypothetical protein
MAFYPGEVISEVYNFCHARVSLTDAWHHGDGFYRLS